MNKHDKPFFPGQVDAELEGREKAGNKPRRKMKKMKLASQPEMVEPTAMVLKRLPNGTYAFDIETNGLANVESPLEEVKQNMQKQVQAGLGISPLQLPPGEEVKMKILKNTIDRDVFESMFGFSYGGRYKRTFDDIADEFEGLMEKHERIMNHFR